MTTQLERLKEAFAGNDHAQRLIQEGLWGRLGEHAEDTGTEHQKQEWRNYDAVMRQKSLL